jgi:TPP-dependent pyruvate/acetoin dehydrogenase alpha subunit
MTGHSAHDDANYVPAELFEFWETRDPILRLERTLVEAKAISEAGITEMQNRIHAEIDEAISLRKRSLSRSGRLHPRRLLRRTVMALTTYVDAIRQEFSKKWIGMTVSSFSAKTSEFMAALQSYLRPSGKIR